MTKAADIDWTFDEVSLFGSRKWAAARIGRPYSWFSKNMKRLKAEGFPEVDPLVGLYVKSDVDEWVERRKKISGTVEAPDQKPPTGVKYDEL